MSKALKIFLTFLFMAVPLLAWAASGQAASSLPGAGGVVAVQHQASAGGAGPARVATIDAKTGNHILLARREGHHGSRGRRHFRGHHRTGRHHRYYRHHYGGHHFRDHDYHFGFGLFRPYYARPYCYRYSPLYGYYRLPYRYCYY